MVSSKGSNSMWKLDLLEAKFNDSVPRFPHTKKLLTARHNEKLLKKLPTSQEDANHEIRALKEEFFAKKYHGAYKKLEKEVKKVYKGDSTKFKEDDSKTTIIQFFESNQNLQLLINSRLIKSVITSILNTKALKDSPFDFIPQEITTNITDKQSERNPTHFFKTFCQDNKILNNYISSLWNNKSVKTTLEEIEWSFKLVRGDLTKEEKAKRKSTGKNVDEDDDEEAGEVEDEDEDDDEDDDDDSDEEDSNDVDEDIDLEEAYDKFAVYDKLIGGSDEVVEEDEQFELDPEVNYNEITDEEASEQSASEIDDSDSDSDSDEPKSKTAKTYDLPALASGYFSGGSDDEDDDDIDNDKVVKEITTQRKNRRGQRARQKIWAQKYGKEAKHVQTQRAAAASDREIRQAEYEERQKKREAKAALASAPSGANVAPLGERKSRSSTPVPASVEVKEPAKMHPSWEAKKIAEEKLKNVKFTGKKITFD